MGLYVMLVSWCNNRVLSGVMINVDVGLAICGICYVVVGLDF